MAEGIWEELKRLAPHVAFDGDREPDPYFSWDGDGPDPRDDGYEPCNVEVKAQAICGGKLIEGVNYLGGSYFLPKEPLGDVHGYLWQMLEEAGEELRELLPATHPASAELLAVSAFLSGVMRAEWEAQRAAA